MYNTFARAAIFAALLGATPAGAKDLVTPADSLLMKDMLSVTYGAEPFEASVPRYLAMFRQNNLDGEPGYSARDREMQMLAWLAKVRAGLFEDFFLEDIDGNMVITTDEMRVRLTFEAYNYTHPGFSSPPTIKDVERYIAQKTNAKLRNDLDGDGALSFDEMRVVHRDLVENARPRFRPPHMAPSLQHDTDADGIISEDELLRLARRIYDAFDADGNERISPQERVAAGQIIKSPPRFMLSLPNKETPTCVFPDFDPALGYHVIGGYDGAAMTDVYFDDTLNPVEMVAIQVPTVGASFNLIASFRDQTILQIDDPAGRVRTIYGTRGSIGVVGAPSAKLVQTDISCHLPLWKPSNSKNPNPTVFYTAILKRPPISIIRDYTVGIVDLGLGTNADRKRFSDSIGIDIIGKQGSLWTHFLRFNPGGLVQLDPTKVSYSGTVSKHTIWPQFAGLAQLVDSGVLRVLPRDGQNKWVKGNRREVLIDGKRFRPNGGDTAILRNGYLYTYEIPGRWIGRVQLQMRVEGAFTYPAGLAGAHSVAFILPTDTPEPQGDKATSELLLEGELKAVTKP